MGDHLIHGQFKSDKYAWCPPGFLALKLTDRTAQPLIWEYAQQHRPIDSDLSDDLECALVNAGFEPPLEDHLARTIVLALGQASRKTVRAVRTALGRIRI
jgi:hypothetical protein